jgi:4-hydroxybenzoate polyprenyltransferase
MNWSTALTLGRVSNLPTVLTNSLTGLVLVGGAILSSNFAIVLVAMSLFYLGGMFLNDYFDRDIDARDRPERPIASGAVAASTVVWSGTAMLAVGIVALALAATMAPEASIWKAGMAGIGLAIAIVFYDWRHKGNPVAPLIMGACRGLIYFGCGLVFVANVSFELFAAALALLCYVAGLTYAAKQEELNRVDRLWPLVVLAAPIIYTFPAAQSAWLVWVLWLIFVAWVCFALRFLVDPRHRHVPLAVAYLLAGISLLDAVLIAKAGEPALAVLAGCGFLLTLFLQRFIAAT